MAKKKIVDKGAYLQMKHLEELRRDIVGTVTVKGDRDPLTRKLKQTIGYLKKLAHGDIKTEEQRNQAIVDDPKMKNKAMIEEYRELIEDMTVRGFVWVDIRKAIYDRCKQLVHPNSLKHAIKQFKDTEGFLQRYQEFLGSTDHMRLYTKSGRLEELTNLYRDAQERYKTKKGESTMNQLIKILEQARKESDAAAVYNFKMVQNNMQINGSVNFNMLNREVEKDLFKNMPLHEIIMGRIARKMKVNPMIMMRRLHNSYYSAQSGIEGLEKLDDKIRYPSELLYDVEGMVDNQKKIQAEEAQIVEEIDDIEEKPNAVKQALLERVRKAKEKRAQDENKDFKRE